MIILDSILLAYEKQQFLSHDMLITTEKLGDSNSECDNKGGERNKPPTATADSDNLRSAVCKVFGFQSTNGNITSKDVLICRICSLYQVSLNCEQPEGTFRQCTMCTLCRDSLTKLTFQGVQKPQLAVASRERCPSLLTDITKGLTPCINTAAKAGKIVAISNVRFLFSKCLTTLTIIRSTAYAHM